MEIFRLLLLTRYTKRAAPYKPRIPHALQPAILRVCYQFRQEAGDVLYRENVLIHVITNYPNLACDLELAGLSSVAKGTSAELFPHYSLRVNMLFHGVTLGDHHFMIGAEDLQLFCSLFWLLRIRRDHQLTLHLSVLLPFPDLPPSISKQEALISPFKQLWHISRAAVNGYVDPKVADRLKFALTHMIPQTPGKVLEFVQSLSDNGDQCFSVRDYFGSAVQYYQALAACQLLRLPSISSFPSSVHHQPYLLHNTAVSLSELLLANITLAFLRLGAWRDAEELADASVWFLFGARRIPYLVIAYFRRAIARRELGNLIGARGDFDTAAFQSRTLVNGAAVERYIRMEETRSLDIYPENSDLDMTDIIARERAQFGFI